MGEHFITETGSEARQPEGKKDRTIGGLFAKAKAFGMEGAEPEDGQTIVDLTWIRGSGKILFRPQLFYQEVLSIQMAERSLHFILGMGGDGKNYARLGVGEEVDRDSNYARSCARCVDPRRSPSAEDAELVSNALRKAATWGDPAAVRHLLTSCYCTPQTTASALGEASAMGFEDVVTMLLAAGARATMRFNGKTALHRACEEGQEGCAKLLIQSISTRDAIMVPNNAGITAFEVARQQDMGGFARRLEAFAEAHLPVSSNSEGSHENGLD